MRDRLLNGFKAVNTVYYPYPVRGKVFKRFSDNRDILDIGNQIFESKRTQLMSKTAMDFGVSMTTTQD